MSHIPPPNNQHAMPRFSSQPARDLFRKELKSGVYCIVADFWPDLITNEELMVLVDRVAVRLIDDLDTLRSMNSVKADLGDSDTPKPEEEPQNGD